MALRSLSGLRHAELRYGRIRLWGSVGFALANLSAGWPLDWLPISSIIGMLLLSALATALAAVVVAHVRFPDGPGNPATAMTALTALAGYVYGSWGEQILSLIAAASNFGVLLPIPVAASLRGEQAQPLAVASDAELPLQKLG